MKKKNSNNIESLIQELNTLYIKWILITILLNFILNIGMGVFYQLTIGAS